MALACEKALWTEREGAVVRGSDRAGSDRLKCEAFPTSLERMGVKRL